MVCGAPMSCSSGGRSAVQTMSGHPGLVGLDDGRMQLGRGGAAGDADDRRACRRPWPDPGRRTRRCARRAGRGLQPRRQGKASSASTATRGRSRHRSPRPDPFVHQGGAKVACTLTMRATPRRGARSGPPLVMLHGFTQTGRLWGPFGDLLEADRSSSAVDLPGHAGSDAVRADLPATAALVRRGGRGGSAGAAVDLLGYSLGRTGRPARGLGLRNWTIEPSGLHRRHRRASRTRSARERRAADERVGRPNSRPSGDVEAFVERWLSGPMFVRLADGRPAHERRLRNTATGLASSLRLCGTGTQEPSWDRLATCAPPFWPWPAPTTLASPRTRCVWPARAPRHGLARARWGPRRPPGPTGQRSARLVCHWLGVLATGRLRLRHRSKPRSARGRPHIWRRAVSPDIGQELSSRLSLRARRPGAMASGWRPGR